MHRPQVGRSPPHFTWYGVSLRIVHHRLFTNIRSLSAISEPERRTENAYLSLSTRLTREGALFLCFDIRRCRCRGHCSSVARWLSWARPTLSKGQRKRGRRILSEDVSGVDEHGTRVLSQVLSSDFSRGSFARPLDRSIQEESHLYALKSQSAS